MKRLARIGSNKVVNQNQISAQFLSDYNSVILSSENIMKHILGFILIAFSFLANANNDNSAEEILAGAWMGIDQDENFSWELCAVLSDNGKLKITTEIFDNKNEKKPIATVHEGTWRVNNNYYVMAKKMTSYQGLEVNDDVRTEKYKIEHLKKDLFIYRYNKTKEKFVLKKVTSCET